MWRSKDWGPRLFLGFSLWSQLGVKSRSLTSSPQYHSCSLLSSLISQPPRHHSDCDYEKLDFYTTALFLATSISAWVSQAYPLHSEFLCSSAFQNNQYLWFSMFSVEGMSVYPSQRDKGQQLPKVERQIVPGSGWSALDSILLDLELMWWEGC